MREDDITALAGAVAYWVHSALIVSVYPCRFSSELVESGDKRSFRGALLPAPGSNVFFQSLSMERPSSKGKFEIIPQHALEESNQDACCPGKWIPKSYIATEDVAVRLASVHCPGVEHEEQKQKVTGFLAMAVLGKYVGVDAMLWNLFRGSRAAGKGFTLFTPGKAASRTYCFQASCTRDYRTCFSPPCLSSCFRCEWPGFCPWSQDETPWFRLSRLSR